MRATIHRKLAGCATCNPSGEDGIMFLIITESLKVNAANQALQGLSAQQQEELRKRLADLQKQAEELANELKTKNSTSFFQGMANFFTGNDSGVGNATPPPAARPIVLPSR